MTPVKEILKRAPDDVLEFMAKQKREEMDALDDLDLDGPANVEEFLEDWVCNGDLHTAITLTEFKKWLEENGAP